MNDTEDENGKSVNVSMGITGQYDDVMTKLRSPTDRQDATDQVLSDLNLLVETVVELNGGTRSAIADRLPEKTAVEYDAQAVVEALQVLERYELVVLEGNTWKPGPKLDA